MTQTTTLRLLEDLLARRSVSPDDAGCQALIAQRLAAQGFDVEHLPFGPDAATAATDPQPIANPPGGPVSNLWALRAGTRPGPTLVLAGHTDVVPSGPAERWGSPPFVPHYRDGRLYARGAADMKTSLAAMVAAVEDFIQAHPDHAGRIAFLLTSDEEGPAIDGTARVVQTLRERGERLDACIVGEPTCAERLGDTIKNGRRGSLSGHLVVRGVQGHVAYPDRALNPVHQAAPVLAELAAISWDNGGHGFPPTTWQISNIHAGTGAMNIIPGELTVDFNFRFGPASRPADLQARMADVLKRHELNWRIDWILNAEPFFTPEGSLVAALREAIRAETGLTANLSTTGGTSDGRFIATLCQQVVEFGPVNASIHQIDEHVAVADIAPLSAIYRRVLERLLA